MGCWSDRPQESQHIFLHDWDQLYLLRYTQKNCFYQSINKAATQLFLYRSFPEMTHFEVEIKNTHYQRNS